MKTSNVDIVIIGAGPAGLAAAEPAKKNGAESVVVIERAAFVGGILPQCVHNGFGLHRFKEELTGPEYARRCADAAFGAGVDKILLNTMVVGLDGTKVTCMSRERGVETFNAGAVVLAMGCRERTRGNIGIPGTRPAGVFSAGTAQKLVNTEGYSVGKKAVVLGSGDVGLIMARRLTLEGAEVACVCEIMPRSGGLERNIKQCLEDFDIPLLLNTTVCEIHGVDRVEGVTIANVDEKMKPVKGSERFVECDTLLLSVGLAPENELSLGAGVTLAPNGGAAVDRFLRTSVEGVFACGNVVSVHDLVDFVSEEGEFAGGNAARFVRGEDLAAYEPRERETVKNDAPLQGNEKRLTCVVCPVGCRLSAFFENGAVARVEGNRCARGVRYAEDEFTDPKRTLTSVARGDGRYVPVKTDKPVSKRLLRDIMREVRAFELSGDVKIGDVLIADVLGTGAAIVACSDIIFRGKA